MNAPKKIWVNEFVWKDYITSKNDVPYTRADIVDELWEDSITSKKDVPYIRADLVDEFVKQCQEAADKIEELESSKNEFIRLTEEEIAELALIDRNSNRALTQNGFAKLIMDRLEEKNR